MRSTTGSRARVGRDAWAAAISSRNPTLSDDLTCTSPPGPRRKVSSARPPPWARSRVADRMVRSRSLKSPSTSSIRLASSKLDPSFGRGLQLVQDLGGLRGVRLLVNGPGREFHLQLGYPGFEVAGPLLRLGLRCEAVGLVHDCLQGELHYEVCHYHSSRPPSRRNMAP